MYIQKVNQQQHVFKYERLYISWLKRGILKTLVEQASLVCSTPTSEQGSETSRKHSHERNIIQDKF